MGLFEDFENDFRSLQKDIQKACTLIPDLKGGAVTESTCLRATIASPRRRSCRKLRPLPGVRA